MSSAPSGPMFNSKSDSLSTRSIRILLAASDMFSGIGKNQPSRLIQRFGTPELEGSIGIPLVAGAVGVGHAHLVVLPAAGIALPSELV